MASKTTRKDETYFSKEIAESADLISSDGSFQILGAAHALSCHEDLRRYFGTRRSEI